MANRFLDSLKALEQNEVQPPAAPTPQSAQSATILSDIVNKLPQKSSGRGHNLYLAKPVSQALEREAKRRNITKSQLVNEILKRVLVES